MKSRGCRRVPGSRATTISKPLPLSPLPSPNSLSCLPPPLSNGAGVEWETRARPHMTLHSRLGQMGPAKGASPLGETMVN